MTDARPIFVLGGHRGGTTLLQRLLNSYADVAVMGEHEGVLTPIAEAYFKGVESTQLFRDVRAPGTTAPRDDWQAWMSAVTSDDWDAGFRTLVRSLVLPSDPPGLRFWGFKEIRYGTTPDDRAIDLLAHLFPDARFAFIVRNPFNMLASAHSRPEGPRTLGDVVRVCRRLGTRFATYRRWHADRRITSDWIVYEELCREAGDIHGLLAALGHELSPAAREVIAAEGGGRGSSFHDGAVNERWQHLPALWLAVARHALGSIARELGYPLPPVSPLLRIAAPAVWRRAGGGVIGSPA